MNRPVYTGPICKKSFPVATGVRPKNQEEQDDDVSEEVIESLDSESP